MERNKGAICSYCGLGDPLAIRGLCRGHYTQKYKRGEDLKPLRPRRPNGSKALDCSFEGCGNPQRMRKLCSAHARQLKAGRTLTPLQQKGVGHITEHGYRLISRIGHPNAYPNGKIPEHRWAMAEHLGRPLLPGEEVHHLNGRRADNRLENLELWAVSQPRGQRVLDLIDHAREILERYADIETVLREDAAMADAEKLEE